MGLDRKVSKRRLQSNIEVDGVKIGGKKNAKKDGKNELETNWDLSGHDVSISEDESNPETSEGDAFSNSEDGSNSERETEDEADDKQTEAQNGAEMEELEREYSNLRDREEDLLKSLKRSKDEDLLKGQAVKNQKVLWDKALELRILLQKPFSSSNKLPQEPLRSSFCSSDKEVDQAYSDLLTSSEQTLNCFLELQEALLEKNPFFAQVSATGTEKESSEGPDAANYSDLESDETWSQIHRMHCRIAPFRDSSIDKWQRKSQVTTGAAAFKSKLQAFNQSISQQVATYMRDPSRLIKRMQLRRSSVGIFGEEPEEVGKVKEEPEEVGKAKEDPNADGDPELLDDSEFYQLLLKEFLESFDPTQSGTNIYALNKLQTKKRKIVDRRASKSRKIRYHVHEKIVNFMAPEPMKLPPMAPKLFENLFGLKNKKSSQVS